ncbi:hypothetical protein NXS08_05010 [Gleimia sp. 6138-11-ORH1]|uniref:hypothetical protein n=1 Tax=Gleimia sp. 6138-11-ORH1 TaxID=2973937 RepID=UPI002167BA84|nr:hypothetical protein [Gleimia sp. 6138-11-ORH1]MCS4484836.1 hypothetical protein [Gleimia sp. 6138-11-ORH1]
MQKRDATSDTLLKTAVCYAVALQFDLEAPEEPNNNTEDTVQELSATLKNLGVEDYEAKAKKIVALAAAAHDHVSENDTVLSVTKYDAQRVKILRDLRLRSARGLQLWPPTSQTIITRMGGRWSNAMTACGLSATAGVEIGHHNVRFTTDDHIAAIRKYVAQREAENRTASYAGYVVWAREQNPRVPSGALLREIYRTWSKALEVAGIESK